jgi:hypothetical protein
MNKIQVKDKGKGGVSESSFDLDDLEGIFLVPLGHSAGMEKIRLVRCPAL